jgi:hypothetical protein
MEFLILIFVAIISFCWGWNLRERVVIKQTNKMFESLAKELQDEERNLIKIKIEKHNDMLLAYHYEDSLFIAQANNRKELEDRLSEKYPGKRFGCTEDNLKEIGFRT